MAGGEGGALKGMGLSWEVPNLEMSGGEVSGGSVVPP